MSTEKAKRLLKKYLNDQSSPQEELVIAQWYKKLLDSGTTDFNPAELEKVKARMENRLMQSIKKNRIQFKRRRLFQYFGAAAAALFLGVLSYTYYIIEVAYHPLEKSELVALMPSPQHVLIRFSNGKIVNPDTIVEGKFFPIEKGLEMQKTKSGKIQFIAQANYSGRQVSSTIQTSGATHFGVVLSDGTEVYVNANSRFTFPAAFGKDDRVVALKGEAYFEVFKTAQHSRFYVKTKDQTIKVLGTKFNVSAIGASPITKTTLVEGSVSVTPKDKAFKEVIIKPNQQLVLKGDGTQVLKVDAPAVMSWKDGYFVFNGKNTLEVLGQIGSWYNLEVENEHNGNLVEYIGKIPTEVSLGELLNILNYTGIQAQVLKNKNGKLKLIIL
ncbi:FecR domain-containing protein [Pedobacter sp. MC2016-14]|uniref:FecR family protein n=1 Tax=Pedobacter sp. MC2016-14 TaxID=2897327 RepID=UPI001E328FB7|nr:FecR family protein [Pedobacter sp. MC2016-14]MCD0487799.1 FecR domain-containing protein [Pedobacter sp. MC2016-14]